MTYYNMTYYNIIYCNITYYNITYYNIAYYNKNLLHFLEPKLDFPLIISTKKCNVSLNTSITYLRNHWLTVDVCSCSTLLCPIAILQHILIHATEASSSLSHNYSVIIT